MKTSSTKNLFITFEGLDGCGKEIQMMNLVQLIRKDNGYPFGNKYSNIWITREPTKITKAGETISRLIRERDVTSDEALYYYIKDRIEHTKIIKEILKHSHVLSNRYDLSTFTYQHAQGVSIEKIYKMHGFLNGKTIIPDISIIFVVSVEIALQRTETRNEAKECFEQKEFLEKAYKSQQEIIKWWQDKGRKIIVINGNKSIEEVKNEMVEKIYKVLNN